ncbi:HEWD family protein [Haloferax sp. DFSO52]|uniref:HEWD family protein n=1 Tax=Haloferax sp. DFSO52 TaxID=3388505 RepID=UPI003A86A33E
MGPQLRRPTHRSCELCGRVERWDDDVATWRVATEDGEKQVGKPFCIHEWDINGRFAPFKEPA